MGVSDVRFPRTYSILTQEDFLSFVDEYIMTACISLLKVVVRSQIGDKHGLLRDGEVFVQF